MLVASTVLAQMARNGARMDWDGGTPWWRVVVMILLVLVVLGVIVWAVVYVTRRSGGGPAAAPTAGPGSARDILDQRYARGEIDTAEYEERRAKLT